MPLYQRKLLPDQIDVGDPGPLPLALAGISQDLLADLSWRGPGYENVGFFPVAEPPPAPASRWLHKVYVIARIPVEKQAAILLAATLGSPTYDVEVHVTLFQLTQSDLIDLDGQLLTTGLGLLISKGLLTADDMAAIRADP